MRPNLRAPQTKVLARIGRAKFIGEFLEEVVDKLTGGIHESWNELVENGIVKNQFIGEITIRYLIAHGKSDKRKIGEVSIHIDWEKYKINLGGFGEELEIDYDVGRIEQVSQVLVVLLEFLDDYRKKQNATTQITLQWAPGVDAGEARRAMKTVQADNFKWLGSELHDFSFSDLEATHLKKAVETGKAEQGVDYEFTLTPKLLSEIQVRARITDPKSLQTKAEK